jgi:host factor-I protein
VSNIQFTLQDPFLNAARKKKVAVTVYLVSGVQLKGQITAFDNFVIVLQSEGKQQMIYKHAISTIAPAKPVIDAQEKAAANK